MAGDVNTAMVVADLSTSAGGTSDFTQTGFGTPVCALVIAQQGDTDETNDTGFGNANGSVGFTDFTNERCIAFQSNDGAKMDCDDFKSSTFCYVGLDSSGNLDFSGTASTITDGVRLTHETGEAPSAAYPIIVLMFGGADVEVSIDSPATPNSIGGTTQTTTGIDQSLVFFIALDNNTEDADSTGINGSFGCAHINAAHDTFVNKAVGWSHDHNNAASVGYSVTRSDRCVKILTEGGADDWGLDVTGANATSFTFTERDVKSGTAMEVYTMAIALGNRLSKIGSIDTPNATGAWTPSVSLGFTPQTVLFGTQTSPTEDTIALNQEFGISVNTGAGEEASISFESSGAVNISGSAICSLHALAVETSTLIIEADHTSFDDGGWTYESATALARPIFYVAIEEQAPPPPVELSIQPFDLTQWRM